MQVKNNYNECITNLACSIRKYFDLNYKHNTLDYIDKILEEVKPKNVVMILCDGMGDNILKRTLDENSFLIKHRLKGITTVFPATTVSATTSITTGLNPVETGMLAWHMYYKDLDKTITTFKDCDKLDETETPLEEAKAYKKKHMITKTLMSEINEAGKYKAYHIAHFGGEEYADRDEMYKMIEDRCNEEGKKYIYAHDLEPDSTMHILTSQSDEAKNLIKEMNERIELLSHKLKDTIIFVVADHGHLTTENVFFRDYPEIRECFVRTTSLEPRAVNFFIKEEMKERFVKLFNQNFGEDFDLYEKEDVIASKLFGDGEENEIYRDALGDYIAIANGTRVLLDDGSSVLASHHAGYTDDEIIVPLIVIDTNKV